MNHTSRSEIVLNKSYLEKRDHVECCRACHAVLGSASVTHAADTAPRYAPSPADGRSKTVTLSITNHHSNVLDTATELLHQHTAENTCASA